MGEWEGLAVGFLPSIIIVLTESCSVLWVAWGCHPPSFVIESIRPPYGGADGICGTFDMEIRILRSIHTVLLD